MNERIKAVRKALRKTQSAFAEELGVTGNYVWMIENGKSDPSDRMIKDIVRLFDVNEIWLRTGEGEMFKPMTRNEEISRFFYDVLKEDDESFQKRFVSALASCTPEMWEAFAKFVDDLAK